jgi:hypothetical protein
VPDVDAKIRAHRDRIAQDLREKQRKIEERRRRHEAPQQTEETPLRCRKSSAAVEPEPQLESEVRTPASVRSRAGEVHVEGEVRALASAQSRAAEVRTPASVRSRADEAREPFSVKNRVESEVRTPASVQNQKRRRESEERWRGGVRAGDVCGGSPPPDREKQQEIGEWVHCCVTVRAIAGRGTRESEGRPPDRPRSPMAARSGRRRKSRRCAAQRLEPSTPNGDAKCKCGRPHQQPFGWTKLHDQLTK